METESIHELTAAYALDALDSDDQRAYEEHLARCPRCREELATLSEASTALAYAVDAPAPPRALRERILSQARADRSNVVPLRRRWVLPTTAAVAAAAACAAIGLGLWAASLSRSLDRERTARQDLAQAASLIAAQDARRVPVGGRVNGALVVVPGGEAALVLSRLAPAPTGKTYEAWVFEGKTPRPAGLFDGGRTTLVRLTRPVKPGSLVAVTLEREGGVQAPTREPLLTAQA